MSVCVGGIRCLICDGSLAAWVWLLVGCAILFVVERRLSSVVVCMGNAPLGIDVVGNGVRRRVWG